MQEVVNWKPKLTPKSRHDFPHAPPNHNAAECEDVVIDANRENPFDCLSRRLDVLLTLDNVVVKDRPAVVKRDSNRETDGEGLPKREISIQFIVGDDVVPCSSPVDSIPCRWLNIKAKMFLYQKPTTSGETMKIEIKLSRKLKNFLRKASFGLETSSLRSA